MALRSFAVRTGVGATHLAYSVMGDFTVIESVAGI